MLQVAYMWATFSHDPSSQNGATVVRTHPEGFTEVSRGWNHVPGLREDSLERVLCDRNLKYPRVIHAEVDAIVAAGFLGRSVQGATMVCPWAACLGCVGPILRSGISTLLVHRQRFDAPYQAWNQGIVDAHEWLHEAGVELIAYDGEIPEAPLIRVDYTPWQP